MVIRNLYFFTLVVGLFLYSCDSQYEGKLTIEDLLNVPADIDMMSAIASYKLDVTKGCEGERTDFQHDLVKTICSKTVKE